MEPTYCGNDDYSFIQDRLKYSFVKKGHYALRQGQPGSEVFFIVKGSAEVLMHGPEDKHYLDHKAMYNEISLSRSRARGGQMVKYSTIVPTVSKK